MSNVTTDPAARDAALTRLQEEATAIAAALLAFQAALSLEERARIALPLHNLIAAIEERRGAPLPLEREAEIVRRVVAPLAQPARRRARG